MSHAALLDTLLKGKSPSEFSAYDLDSKAYYRSSRKQPLEAAVLFEAAAVRAEEEFADGTATKVNEAGIRINQALNSWARAGFNYYKAGEEAYAIELFERCVAADWLAAGLNHDVMTVGFCWEYLVKAQVGNGRQAFETALEEATTRCAALSLEFPLSHPTIKELALAAREMGLEARATQMVAPLRSYRPMKRELKAWLKAFDAAV